MYDDVDRKRKHLTDTESEAEEVPKNSKNSKRAKKELVLRDDTSEIDHHHTARCDSDDELPIIAKRPPGRPPIDKENRPPKGFDVSAVVEVSRPPLHVKGKTARGNKWVKQEPIRLGPFRFNDRTSWTGFQKQVRRTAYITEEQMVLSGMMWHTNKSANSVILE